MRKSFTLSCLILATIIGAGFASGKEIQVFFSKFGVVSFFTIVLTFFIFLFAIRLLLKYSSTFKPDNIFIVNKQLFGKFSTLFNTFILLCYCIVLSGMYAGIYEVYLTVFSLFLSKILTIITVFIVVFILCGGLNRINNFNNLFIPITIILLIISAIFSLKNNNIPINVDLKSNVLNAVFSAVNYVGINILLSSSILILSGKNYTKKQINLAAIISSLVIVFLIFLFNFVLINNNVSSNLPMQTISSNINFLWGIIVLICIWVAVFSSILSVSFTIVSVVNLNIKSNLVSVIIVSVLGYVFSMFGFSKIVEIFYPVIGVLGIILILTIYIKQTTMQNKKINQIKPNNKNTLNLN